jgi:putative hydrolase of the HAD superfamily
MKTRVVSIDLWGTIFDPNGEISAASLRRRLVREYAAKRGITDADAVDKAYETAGKHFYDTYHAKAITLTSRERLAHQFEIIGLEPSGDEFDLLLTKVEDAIVDYPPPLAQNIRDGLEALANRYRLAVISDTGFSPGRAIRRVFQMYDIARYFADYSFSDENRKSKPDPYAFTSVLDRLAATPAESLHIGDTEPTDIVGAKRLGAKACLYVGISDSYLDATTADFVLRDWSETAGLIEHIENSQHG